MSGRILLGEMSCRFVWREIIQGRVGDFDEENVQEEYLGWVFRSHAGLQVSVYNSYDLHHVVNTQTDTRQLLTGYTISSDGGDNKMVLQNDIMT